MLVIHMRAVDPLVLEVRQGNVGAEALDQSSGAEIAAALALVAFHDDPVCPDVG